jgi:hypothetical protein
MNVVFFQHLVLYATFVDFERLAARVRGCATSPVLWAA